MDIYSYYYGASPAKGIDVQSESPELKDTELEVALKGLAAFASDKPAAEPVMFVYSFDGNTVLGTSFAESASANGYGRIAPCSIQYVVNTEALFEEGSPADIINGVTYSKPQDAAPAPLDRFPTEKRTGTSGVSFKALKCVYDVLKNIDSYGKKSIVMIGLPKASGKPAELARSVLAEVAGALTPSAFGKLRIVTSLPDFGGKAASAEESFEKLWNNHINVAFCTAEQFAKVKNLGCIAIDLAHPAAVGAPAKTAKPTAKPAPRKDADDDEREISLKSILINIGIALVIALVTWLVTFIAIDNKNNNTLAPVAEIEVTAEPTATPTTEPTATPTTEPTPTPTAETTATETEAQ